MSFLSIRRFISRISIRLLAFNVLLVFLPAAGVSYLAIYERKLLEAQERSMVQQGRLLAAALSDRGELTRSLVEPTLVRLEQRTTSRIRVLDRNGWLISDTSRLGPQRDAEGEGPPDTATLRESWLYRIGSSLFVPFERLLLGPGPVVGEEYYSAEDRFEGVEIQEALAGRYGAATRITPGGQRSVTLYSALPVDDEGAVVGVVLVSESTFRILQDLYEVRLAVFRYLLGAAGVAAVLSLLVSTTISRPLKRLRSEAQELLDRRGRLTGRFRGSRRLDEIGDLSRALQELSHRLEERMRFIEAFAADVSHEFKNPLASIRSAAEMLGEVEEPEARRRFASMVESDIARLEKLLSSVREITLLDASPAARDEAETADVGELVRGVAEAERYRGRGVELELDLPETPLEARANPERLVRVFENLLDNAIGFSPEGGRVHIAAGADGDDVRVVFEDEGPGVSEEHRARIFERFFSHRPNEDRSGQHAGLGLAIVKAILERYGGTIELAPSSPGSGSAFVVRLRRA